MKLQTMVKTLGIGAALGLGLAVAYGIVFSAYAIIRSSAQIVMSLPAVNEVAQAIVLSGSAIFFASVATALLLGVFAAMTEALTLLVARNLTAWFDPAMTQGHAAAIGFCVAATITLVVNLLLWRGLGVFFDQLWPSGYLFWIGLPGAIYMIATAAAMQRWIVIPAPAKV